MSFDYISSKAISVFWLALQNRPGALKLLARKKKLSDWLKFILKKLRRAPRGVISFYRSTI